VLSAAGIDCCVLANNHVLDWGYAGLAETLETLRRQGIRTCGAGAGRSAAEAPAIVDVSPQRRILVFAFCTEDSGVQPEFAATATRAGVDLLPDLSARTCAAIARYVAAFRRAGDLVVASIHWGGNWGYHVGDDERRFAHRLIDEAQVDLVHGHSSHHAKGIEVYRRKLVLYGCGDFVNDYEGIEGHEEYRADLPVMYLPTLDAQGSLAALTLVPLRLRRFRLEPASTEELAWLLAMFNREGERLASRFHPDGNGRLVWETTGRRKGGAA
jgi:poly-gamma-glutamate synthesis protein (capsule biosynthesis protein)